jgi:glycosyltransferase involved in cell wall biosynthesis
MPLDQSNLRLGFYYHTPASWDGESVRVPGFMGRFLDILAEQCDHLTCFFHEAVSAVSRSLCDYKLHSANITCVNLGPPRSAWLCSLYPDPFLKRFNPYRSQVHALLIRGPSPLLPPLARAASGLPIILLLVGDYQESSAVLAQPAWRKFLVRIWARWYTNQQLEIARQSLTFVNSHRLYCQLEPFILDLHETRTTTLETNDIFERSDTCLQRPIRLLYTGRYTVAKGLFDILEAMALLVDRGENVVLDLVGWPESGEEDLIERLLTAAKGMGLSERVVDHGYKPVGPDLFAFYRRADIYVIASQSSFEGFPRTIWEAMVHSLPVVATRVGSIPDFAEGAAELVQPRDPTELARALADVIHKAGLRHDLISRGMELARKNTLNTQVGAMVSTMKAWLVSKPAGVIRELDAS